ncbi:hydrogenase formation protein HypD [Archaeoglobus neptunius]|uniref:hydrogenase formation protein HypD n=1 Tax=Archaeoglobus neptunius TaxID=2798580 RepID=UPI001E64828D|nr:hydrogenase formation protein HypD [Archaeoglobus neptunius]
MKPVIKLAEKIKRVAEDLDEVRLMHLCGTHEDTITRYNLRSLLPPNIRLLSGPGCPVCITPDEDLQMVMHLLGNEKIILTTFGDMMRVPFEGRTLFTMRSEGYDVRMVYSIFDAVKLAKSTSTPVVHFAIGFETTMPSTAIALRDRVENFYVFSSHRFFIPAVHTLAEGIKVDGFINPGHVSTVIGVKPYEEILKKFGIPQVIAGFDPEDVMLSIYLLLECIRDGKMEIVNEYTRAVRYEGNVAAINAINETFDRADWAWRGLGTVRESGGAINRKYEDHDARKFFEDTFKDFQPKEDAKKRACRCGDVLKGVITPDKCPLFMRVCNPRNPVGACMVGFEGTCNIWATSSTVRTR